MINYLELPVRVFRSCFLRRKNSIPWILSFARLKIRGEGNSISLSPALRLKDALGLSLKIRGNNNRIEIGNIRNDGRCWISIGGGHDNRVRLEDGVRIVEKLRLEIGKGCSNGVVEIGEKTTLRDVEIRNFDHGSSVKIGRDCMFSYNVLISNTDEHAIFKDGVLCNAAKDLVIGDHVWVGIGATIFKNAHIGSGSIVASRACVTRKFEEANAVVAGVPANVLKTGITWARESVNRILEGRYYEKR